MAKIKIPFHLCDPAQILFFGSFYELYHQYLEDHIVDFEIEWKDWFKGEVGAPIRGLKTSYNQPLHFGQTYEAKLNVIKIGESTVTFKFEVFGDEADAPRVVSEITHCFVGKENRGKAPVPKLIKQALTKHLES